MKLTLEEPLLRFHEWLDEARKAGCREPSAMALATVDAASMPNVRMVLLKHADERGFVFYTNLASPKASELRDCPFACLCFHWPETRRQVRIQGTVGPVSEAEADAYFATRPRLSQIGAWASRQSKPMSMPLELELACTGMALRFPIGDVPRPPHWSGFRLTPMWIEFWTEQPFRRHERVRFDRVDSTWTQQRLFP